MTVARIGIVLAFVAVLGLPFLVRSPADERGGVVGGDRTEVGPEGTLIVVTPHVEQIRDEFGAAFDRWHRRVHGSAVRVDWRTPGGTSEIVKQLEAQFTAAAKDGRFRVDADGEVVCEPGTIGYDLFFGGGTYDHGQVKRGVTVSIGGEDVRLPMSVPAGFEPSRLEAWFGANEIGAGQLYDPEQYWIGTALSGFGIVYNRRVLEGLSLPEPTSFRDLTDGRYRGLLALADPRLSGSVTTTYDSILNNEGWERGWRVLRELCANARYFASASTRPPIDVSQGEAAAGLAIDFYGRGQAQAVLPPGAEPSSGRVGYVDPRGAVFIDADPATVLRGGPNPALARVFVEFLLTDEAQALWQFRSIEGGAGHDNPVGEDGEAMGPRRYELRRMPVRRVMYERYLPYFVDQVDPFDLASAVAYRGWRSAIGPMMAAFGINTGDDLREAWRVLLAARADPSFPADRLAEMEALFYAMPEHGMKDGTRVPFDADNFRAIRSDTDSWRDPTHGARALIGYTSFFRETYRKVAELGRGAAGG